MAEADWNNEGCRMVGMLSSCPVKYHDFIQLKHVQLFWWKRVSEIYELASKMMDWRYYEIESLWFTLLMFILLTTYHTGPPAYSTEKQPVDKAAPFQWWTLMIVIIICPPVIHYGYHSPSLYHQLEFFRSHIYGPGLDKDRCQIRWYQQAEGASKCHLICLKSTTFVWCDCHLNKKKKVFANTCLWWRNGQQVAQNKYVLQRNFQKMKECELFQLRG